MKKPVNRTLFRTTAGLLMLVGFVVSAPVVAQTPPAHVHTERCANGRMEQLLRSRNPERQQQIESLERQLRAYHKQAGARLANDNTVFRIPVVVHVIHNNSSNFVGGANNPNISDEQIASQIRVLNEDYRRQAGTNGFNTSPIGADTGIEFFLATTDPQGNASNGILRKYYSAKPIFDPFQPDDLKLLARISTWPTDRYLNIWVTDTEGVTIGYGQFPVGADTLRGLATNRDNDIDGVVISYKVFGATACTPNFRSYCQGRTTTHEVGHWLGLIHTWGDSICGDDFVADTPPTQDGNNGTTCGPITSECVPGRRTRNLTENYMDYSPDVCMNMFTVGQRARMRAVLQLSPRRAMVVASSGRPLPESETLTVTMVPNPAQNVAIAEVQFKGAQAPTIDLLDLSGRLVRTQTLSSTVSTRVTIGVSDLPKGMYIVRVLAGSEKASTRLLIN
ncbi:MAG: T9SS C-terminal target domain-containing protein [Cytophagales bacterium]|nr:MAG: T9SS C-terminal target domain-containing protein [Cytophagales bacterium]